MKKIIIRIIVAVAVAIIFSKLKVLNIINVDAREISTKLPNAMAINYSNDQVTSSSNLLTFSYGGTYFFGVQGNLPVGTAINYIRFSIPGMDSLKEKPYMLSFNLYIDSQRTNLTPNVVYIRDQVGRMSYCEVSQQFYQTSSTSQNPYNNSYQAVYCPNVLTTSDLIYVYVVYYNALTTTTNFFGMSQLSAIENSSNDAVVSAIEEGNRNTKETNDLIKSDESVSNSQINDVLQSQDESNSPITDLVSMPITLLNNLYSGFNSSCNSFNLGAFYGTNLTLPCINLSNRLGVLWGVIDVLLSIFLAYNIGLMCIRIYNNLTTLKDDSNSVYGGGN